MLNAFSIILRKTNKELEFVQQVLSDPSLYPIAISLLYGPYKPLGVLVPFLVQSPKLTLVSHQLRSSEVPQMPILVLFP